MSTAEQIIAEHLPDNRDIERAVGNCGCICGWEGWGDTDAEKTAKFAAHVVAALTNAGHAIVELPEADGTTITGGGYDDEMDPPGWTATVRVPKEFACGWTLGDLAGHHEPARVLGAALLSTAAARVAEGGERGEATS